MSMSSCRMPRASPILGGLQQHCQQQPVPQVTAGVQDRLGFRHGQHPRQRPGSFHLHRKPQPGTAPGHVMQERAKRRARIAAARSLDGPQHPAAFALWRALNR